VKCRYKGTTTTELNAVECLSFLKGPWRGGGGGVWENDRCGKSFLMVSDL